MIGFFDQSSSRHCRMWCGGNSNTTSFSRRLCETPIVSQKLYDGFGSVLTFLQSGVNSRKAACQFCNLGNATRRASYNPVVPPRTFG
jgi:hypothetical protein